MEHCSGTLFMNVSHFLKSIQRRTAVTGRRCVAVHKWGVGRGQESSIVGNGHRSTATANFRSQYLVSDTTLAVWVAT